MGPAVVKGVKYISNEEWIGQEGGGGIFMIIS